MVAVLQGTANLELGARSRREERRNRTARENSRVQPTIPRKRTLSGLFSQRKPWDFPPSGMNEAHMQGSQMSASLTCLEAELGAAWNTSVRFVGIIFTEGCFGARILHASTASLSPGQCSERQHTNIQHLLLGIANFLFQRRCNCLYST